MRIAIIPARGGSRRIPGKNIRPFHGRPIIAYSIEAAKQTGLFEWILVSTDDAKIRDVAFDCKCGVLERDPAYAVDEVGTQDVARHVLEALQRSREKAFGGFELTCVIYPTAPLMACVDIHRGLAHLLTHSDTEFAFSVGTEPLADAGQFYWGWSQHFGRRPLISAKTVMVPIDSQRVCDINTEEDWARAEAMYSSRLHNEEKRR
jgi:N-acylneuraminate cytidylyltransferase